MEQALMPLAKEIGFAVEVLDVDASADLEARYDQWVPVLLHEGSELCHYFLDEAKVRVYLSKIR